MIKSFKAEWKLFKDTVSKDRFVRFASKYNARNVQKIEDTPGNADLIAWYRRSPEWREI